METTKTESSQKISVFPNHTPKIVDELVKHNTTHSWYVGTIQVFNLYSLKDPHWDAYNAILLLRNQCSIVDIYNHISYVAHKDTIPTANQLTYLEKIKTKNYHKLKEVLHRLYKLGYVRKYYDENKKDQEKFQYSMTKQFENTIDQIKKLNYEYVRKHNEKIFNHYDSKLLITDHSYFVKNQSENKSLKDFLNSEIMDILYRKNYTTYGNIKHELGISRYQVNKCKSIEKSIVNVSYNKKEFNAFNYGKYKNNVFNIGMILHKKSRGTGYKIPKFLSKRLDIPENFEIDVDATDNTLGALGSIVKHDFHFNPNVYQDYLIKRSESNTLSRIKRDKSGINARFYYSRFGAKNRKDYFKRMKYNSPIDFSFSI